MKKEGVEFRGFVRLLWERFKVPGSVFPVYHSTPQSSPCSCKSINVLQCAFSNSKCAHYTVSNTHSCNKRAHITQNMYIHGSHTRLTRFTIHGSHCTRLTCAILFEVAQVQADLMLGRGSKVGRLGAGGLRGITPPII